jgi:hypothetical protein
MDQIFEMGDQNFSRCLFNSFFNVNLLTLRPIRRVGINRRTNLHFGCSMGCLRWLEMAGTLTASVCGAVSMKCVYGRSRMSAFSAIPFGDRLRFNLLISTPSAVLVELSLEQRESPRHVQLNNLKIYRLSVYVSIVKY